MSQNQLILPYELAFVWLAAKILRVFAREYLSAVVIK
jgi:hypothetical protein